MGFTIDVKKECCYKEKNPQEYIESPIYGKMMLFTERLYRKRKKSISQPNDSGLLISESLYNAGFTVCPIINTYVGSGKYGVCALFTCSICHGKKLETNEISLYPHYRDVCEHLHFEHSRLQGDSRTNSVYDRDDKWQWLTIKSTLEGDDWINERYHNIIDYWGRDANFSGCDHYDNCSNILLEIYSFCCNFCGMLYGSPPSRDIICSHLRNCRMIKK